MKTILVWVRLCQAFDNTTVESTIFVTAIWEAMYEAGKGHYRQGLPDQ
jgi:hypothetical protein